MPELVLEVTFLDLTGLALSLGVLNFSAQGLWGDAAPSLCSSSGESSLSDEGEEGAPFLLILLIVTTYTG